MCIGTLDDGFNLENAQKILNVGKLTEERQFFVFDAFVGDFLLHSCVQRFVETVAVERNDDLDLFEDRVVGEDLFQIDRDDARKPVVAVDDRRRPAQFLDRLEHASGTFNLSPFLRG